MVKPGEELPGGEFRKNADRDVTSGPHAPPPDVNGLKERPGAENKDWADMDRRRQEKIQRG
jgi:hypothetical protein